MTDVDIAYEFGSRTGATFALLVLSVFGGMLGYGVASGFRHRYPLLPKWLGNLTAFAFFLLPVLIPYFAYLNGFYTAHIAGETVRLQYLVPVITQEFAAEEVEAVQARKSIAGDWRLIIACESGKIYKSTVDQQDVVQSVEMAWSPQAGR